MRTKPPGQRPTLDVFVEFFPSPITEQDFAGVHQPLGIANLLPTHDQRDPGTPAQEIFQIDDHFLALGELDFAAEIIGALDRRLCLARVFANFGEQIQRLLAVAPPEPAAQTFDRLGRGVAVESHPPGLAQIFLAHRGMRFAVP